MMTIVSWWARVREIRLRLGMTQAELEKRSGIPQTYISRIESGEFKDYKHDTLAKLARGFGLTFDDLMSRLNAKTLEEGEQKSPSRTVPEAIKHLRGELQFIADFLPVMVEVRGYVNAGVPAAEYERKEGTVMVNVADLVGVSKIEEVYALIVSGNSLSGDHIQDKFYVLVDPNAPFINGKIYVVRLEGHEVVARHVYITNDTIKLVSTNGEYKELKADQVEIQGRVIKSGPGWQEH